MAKLLHQYFDKLIKSSLSNTQISKDFLEIHLPERIKKYIDFNKEIELINKEFIKDNQKELRCDVLLKCNIKNQTGYIYNLIEGQSTPDELLPIRIMIYNLELIKWHWQNIEKKIPPICNFILYNGKKSPYPYKINFLDILEEAKITKEIFYGGNIMIDLTIEEDKKIETHKKVAFLEILLKHSRDRDFYNYLREMKKSGKFILLNKEYNIESVLRFVGESLQRKKYSSEEIIELFIGINEKMDKDIMTFTQSIEKVGIDKGIGIGIDKGIGIGIDKGIGIGIDKGIGIGIDKGILSTAKNFLKYGAPVELVKKSTGLDDVKIEELKKEILEGVK